jgi:hypothetical protein
MLEREKDEALELLSNVWDKRQREEYSRRLQCPERQRNAALMELRVAGHMKKSGFPVIEWAPGGQGGSKGEFIVQARAGHAVFVEVKSPDWQAEVMNWNGKKRNARQMQRKKQPKYIDGKGGPTAPWMALRFAINKSYKHQNKYNNDSRNLLVVADDLFVSLEHGTELQAGQALYSTSKNDPGYFTNQRYERLGGVAVFWVGPGIWVSEEKQRLAYHMKLFLNPNAKIELPRDMQRAFRDEATEPKVPLVGREPSPLEKYLANPSEWK